VYTNSFLPGNNCGSSPYPPGALEFFLVTTVGPDPFNLNLGPRFLDLLYFDMLHTDGTFPTTPTIGPPVNALLFKHDFFEFGGSFLPQAAAVEQPAPVPEPGTLGLVGIGLALAARRRRRSNASRVR
jgi:hypothetical protein